MPWPAKASFAILITLLISCSSRDATTQRDANPVDSRAGDISPLDAKEADAKTSATEDMADGLDQGAPHDRAAMAARMSDVVKKLSVDLFPRDWSHPAHLNQAADYIAARLESTTGSVQKQTYQVSGNTYENVIASLGPETNERIVVGAHYDAVEISPGADDNASGVAGLLELADLLVHDSLPMRIELVAFTLEEPPHFATAQMGSAVHAGELASNNVPVRAMFSLEMLGYYSDEAGSQSYPVAALEALYGNVGDFITVVGRTDHASLVTLVRGAMDDAMALRVESIAAPASMTGVDFSDHRSYWAQGWPAVMITDTAFLRNHNYHTAGDTMDTLDFDKMVDVVLGMRAAVLAVAGQPG